MNSDLTCAGSVDTTREFDKFLTTEDVDTIHAASFAMDSGAMDKLEELLPGIEDFLVRALAHEKLSVAAERQRQYFVERLDILKLPPSLPPRAGKRISLELLEETEEKSGIPAELVPDAKQIESEIEKDFAAKQREISRNLLTSVSSDKEDEDEDTDSSKGVKVYDDIDPTESTKNDNVDEEDDDDDINALYEIPVARQTTQPASEADSLSQPADISSLATAGSMDDVNDDVLDTSSPGWQPPPLPPRTKKSESESRNSVNSLEDKVKPPELPFRPPLPRRNEIYARSEKSDKSEKSEKSDVSDGDSTSYESFDEHDQDSELRSKLNIKLPKRSKKKSKTGSKLLSSKARSSSTWEINVPFKKLDNVQLSGDLQHRGKLSWNRRLVAISNGSMALYKPDKEGRPVFVIPLTGCQATVGERDGKKGFEIKLTHKDGDTHLLAADFKEWASVWCDHINAVAQGLPVPSYPQHLARTFSGGSENSAYGSKIDLSLGGYEEGDYEMYEEYTTDNNSVFDTPPPTPQTQHSNTSTLRSPASTGRLASRLAPFVDAIGLRSPASTSRLASRMNSNPDSPQGLKSPASTSRLTSRFASNSDAPGLRSPASTGRMTPQLGRSTMPHNKSFAGLSQQSRTASTLTLSRWDWKTLFYNWSLPIDQIILGLRRGNLSNSNSNLSISSDGVESDDSSKPVKLRGNKVMRMGSFAYRATQFFENLGKKSNAKRKISNLSTPETDLNLRDGIQEESSLSSGSVGLPAVSPSSDQSSPVFVDGSLAFPSSLSSPTSSDALPSPSDVVLNNVKHQGYLNIFSSFNKRRWGQRWCLVRENMFECYKTKTSHPCELNFLLKNCVLRQALAETNSPLAIMLLENNREKITVEPPTKDDLSQWLRVLMVETATEAVPEGLEEFFVDAEDQASDGQAVEAEYTDIMGASVIKSWEVGSAPAMSNPDKDSDAQEQSATTDTAENSETDVVSDQTPDEPVPERYLYTAVVKRPSASTLEEVFEEGNEEDEEQGHAEGGDGDEDGQKDEQEGAKKERVPRFTDNLAVYNANKNTTDSGFYSVKEANSDDSESGSELRSEEASPRQESCSPPPLPSSSPPPLPPTSPPREGATSPPMDTSSESCNTERKEISHSHDVQRPAEDDEDESVLEKTMTADDFTEHMDNGGGDVTPVSSPVQRRASEASDSKKGCDGSAKDSDAAKDNSERNSSVDATNLNAEVQAEQSERLATKQAAEVSEDTQQQQKPKKKKKKSKSKKNKQQKQHSQEETHEQQKSVASANGPHTEQNGGSSMKSDEVISRNDSLEKSKHKADSAERTSRGKENPDSVNASVHTNRQPATVLPTTSRKNSAGGEGATSGETNPAKRETTSKSGETTSASSSSSDRSANALEGRKYEGPEDNETISELRERIGRLREKLIQIKRKRIAVRDKRVRAFSAEERAVCDKEYLVLESECKETSATIQRLEEELKMAVEALGQS